MFQTKLNFSISKSKIGNASHEAGIIHSVKNFFTNIIKKKKDIPNEPSAVLKAASGIDEILHNAGVNNAISLSINGKEIWADTEGYENDMEEMEASLKNHFSSGTTEEIENIQVMTEYTKDNTLYIIDTTVSENGENINLEVVIIGTPQFEEGMDKGEIIETIRNCKTDHQVFVSEIRTAIIRKFKETGEYSTSRIMPARPSSGMAYSTSYRTGKRYPCYSRLSGFHDYYGYDDGYDLVDLIIMNEIFFNNDSGCVVIDMHGQPVDVCEYQNWSDANVASEMADIADVANTIATEPADIDYSTVAEQTDANDPGFGCGDSTSNPNSTYHTPPESDYKPSDYVPSDCVSSNCTPSDCVPSDCASSNCAPSDCVPSDCASSNCDCACDCACDCSSD